MSCARRRPSSPPLACRAARPPRGSSGGTRRGWHARVGGLEHERRGRGQQGRPPRLPGAPHRMALILRIVFASASRSLAEGATIEISSAPVVVLSPSASSGAVHRSGGLAIHLHPYRSQVETPSRVGILGLLFCAKVSMSRETSAGHRRTCGIARPLGGGRVSNSARTSSTRRNLRGERSPVRCCCKALPEAPRSPRQRGGTSFAVTDGNVRLCPRLQSANASTRLVPEL